MGTLLASQPSLIAHHSEFVQAMQVDGVRVDDDALLEEEDEGEAEEAATPEHYSIGMAEGTQVRYSPLAHINPHSECAIACA